MTVYSVTRAIRYILYDGKKNNSAVTSLACNITATIH